MFSLVFACSKGKQHTITYFGGKIINPKSRVILVSNNKGVIDTINLKKDNTFLGKFTDIPEGLYYFSHGPEHQYVYLTPKDSLLLRLNTWNFDESLVFSGKNATKNNMLIDVFLQNEKDERFFYRLFKLDPDTFKAKVDSLKKIKIKKYKVFKANNPNTSKKFLSLLKIAMIYPLYSELENYPINHKNQNKLDSLPITKASFYKHREQAVMNLDSIMFYYPYSHYVLSKIYNDTYKEGHKKNSDDFTIALLKNIDKNIKTEDLKNTYLRHVVVRDFYGKSTCSVNKEVFYTFFKLNTSIKDKKEVQCLLNDAKRLHDNKKIPNFSLVDYNGESKNILPLIKNKKSVIYFRNANVFNDDWVASRIKFLAKKNLDTQFIVINLEDNSRIKKLDIKNQYYLTDKSSANAFLTSKYPRAILVNKKGIIKNSFGSLASQKINRQIADL